MLTETAKKVRGQARNKRKAANLGAFVRDRNAAQAAKLRRDQRCAKRRSTRQRRQRQDAQRAAKRLRLDASTKEFT